MLKNYLKTAVRNLLKHKFYTLINALGLSIGLGSCLFLLAIIQYELSFDQYNVNKGNIYRLNDVIKQSSTQSLLVATTPYPWGAEFKRIFPEIKKMTRFVFRGITVKKDESTFNQPISYVDKDIFDIFSYEFISGDPKTALNEPNTIVITDEVAEKFFPDENAMGRKLIDVNSKGYLITGIIKRIPENSTIQHQAFSSVASLTESDNPFMNDWKSHYIQTFFLMNENFDGASLETKMREFVNTKLEDNLQNRYNPQLMNLGEIHFADNISNSRGDTIDFTYLYIFSIIGFFIFMIACINFMNISTAKSTARAKEVGIRKVAGAHKKQLIFQFLSETFLISVIALIFALVFVELALPWFRALTDREVFINYLSNYSYLSGIFLFTILVGLVAGSYPAFYMSSLMPVQSLKGDKSADGKNAKLRKFLVIGQFTVAIFMIMANIVMLEQINYMKSKYLGFNRDQIVMLPTVPDNTPERTELIKSMLLKNPYITNIAQSGMEPGDGARQANFVIEGIDEPNGLAVRHFSVDHEYFDLLDLEIIKGRGFSKDILSDQADAVIINETAARRFGWTGEKDPLGKTVEWFIEGFPGNKTRKVVGVVKDFHFQNLRLPIRPLLIHLTPENYSYYMVKIADQDVSTTVEFLQDTWKEFSPNSNWHFFLDDDLRADYRFEETIADMIFKFTILTIFTSCLGLLGLAAFTAERRTKEIGVRKVLGASIMSVVKMLSFEFMKYIIISNALAIPMAYFAMGIYLQSFAYNIDIGAYIVLLTLGISLTSAIATVSYQAVKAAYANPVKSLRYE